MCEMADVFNCFQKNYNETLSAHFFSSMQHLFKPVLLVHIPLSDLHQNRLQKLSEEFKKEQEIIKQEFDKERYSRRNSRERNRLKFRT